MMKQNVQGERSAPLNLEMFEAAEPSTPVVNHDVPGMTHDIPGIDVPGCL